MLVHHPDPGLDRVAGGAEGDRLSVQQDLAGIRAVEPVEDVHQRRLAGAVLAEQRVHLAAPDVEVDVVVGDDARELLADPAHLEDEVVGHHLRDPNPRTERAGTRPALSRFRDSNGLES